VKALILAAGLGTRLRPQTHLRPKPLFTLAGTPMLDYHIRALRSAGCEAVFINTHHLHAQIEAFVSSQGYDLPVETRHEPVLLGTGGAIRNLADFWDDRPFFVVNADIFTTIDLAEVYAHHLRYRPAATLVVCDDPEFNTVRIDAQGNIRCFAAAHPVLPAHPGDAALTFTGIQVLEPLVLDYLPAQGFADSIDAYRAMLRDGIPITAYVPRQGRWRDLGDPARYRQSAVDLSAADALRRAFPRNPAEAVRWQPLAGDGSDRRWFRLISGADSLVMADHGLRATNAIAEVDAFIGIGRHLRAKGLPVPAIHGADPFAGLVFLEDLGDMHLQSAVRAAADPERVRGWYRQIVDSAITLWARGAEGFDPAWAYQSPAYDHELILQRECRYFAEAFLNRYAGLEVAFEELRPEFEDIAQGALAHALTGFMHRDMQSRNIMLKDDRWYFIDFQGGRIGPLQYDLASLLIDPYAGLSATDQDHLLEHAAARLAAGGPFDPQGFRRGFAYCALTRNLQILGAFGFLTRVKGKAHFDQYIPAALAGLAARLEGFEPRGFPTLRRAVAQAQARLGLA
jgi:aminoglycoside/choline kinase family phosphotransferase/GTP:adenosylcobinamide-phosphate guanylyltransferase